MISPVNGIDRYHDLKARGENTRWDDIEERMAMWTLPLCYLGTLAWLVYILNT